MNTHLYIYIQLFSFTRAKDKLKQIKTPKNKIKLHERNVCTVHSL